MTPLEKMSDEEISMRRCSSVSRRIDSGGAQGAVVRDPRERLPDRQRQPWDYYRLIHARDFAQDCSAIGFARRCGGIVPTIDVKICRAKDGAVQVRAGREFENVIIPDAGIGRTPEARRH